MATIVSRISRPLPALRTANGLFGLGPRMVFRRPASGRAPQPPKAKKYTLEKPDKFRPPSHPARLKKPKRNEFLGSQPLSPEQKTRSYPKMMPSQGTLKHRILNSVVFHVAVCFVSSEPLMSFHRADCSADGLTFNHPLCFVQRFCDYYRVLASASIDFPPTMAPI